MQANYLRRILGALAAVAVVCGPVATRAFAQAVQELSVARIELEIRELNRLIFRLNRDEQRARNERNLLVKNRANAVKFTAGGSHPMYRIGFTALVQSMEQSPAQASLLRMEAPLQPADEFVPTAKTGFPGGDVHDLLRFCNEQQVNVRYGGQAQLIVAELARDLVRAADARIFELDERIEDFKSQNVAQTDLLGRLMLANAHCHNCRGCWAHGYGWCGATPIVVVGEPAAGLNSKAFDRTLTRRSKPDRPMSAASNPDRLKFLKPARDEAPATSIAGKK